MAARLDIRLEDHEKAELQRQARLEGKTLTALIKDRLFGSSEREDDRYTELDRRLSRLEEMAGL